MSTVIVRDTALDIASCVDIRSPHGKYYDIVWIFRGASHALLHVRWVFLRGNYDLASFTWLTLYNMFLSNNNWLIRVKDLFWESLKELFLNFSHDCI